MGASISELPEKVLFVHGAAFMVMALSQSVVYLRGKHL